MNEWMGIPQSHDTELCLGLIQYFWVVVANHGWSEKTVKCRDSCHMLNDDAIWRFSLGWFLVPLPYQPRYPLLPFLCVFFLQLLKAGLHQNHSCARLIWLISPAVPTGRAVLCGPASHTCLCPRCLLGSRFPWNTTRAPDCPRIEGPTPFSQVALSLMELEASRV